MAMRAYGFGVKRRDYGRTCPCCPPKYRKNHPTGRGAKKRARQEGRRECAATWPHLYPDETRLSPPTAAPTTLDTDKMPGED